MWDTSGPICRIHAPTSRTKGRSGPRLTALVSERLGMESANESTRYHEAGYAVMAPL